MGTHNEVLGENSDARIQAQGLLELFLSVAVLCLSVHFGRSVYKRATRLYDKKMSLLSGEQPAGKSTTPSSSSRMPAQTALTYRASQWDTATRRVVSSLREWLSDGVRIPLTCLCCVCPCWLVCDAPRGRHGAQPRCCHGDCSLCVERDLRVSLLDVFTALSVSLSVPFLVISSVHHFFTRRALDSSLTLCRLAIVPVYMAFQLTRFFMYSSWNLRIHQAFFNTPNAYSPWLLVALQTAITAVYGSLLICSTFMIDFGWKASDEGTQYCESSTERWAYLLSGSLDLVFSLVTCVLFVRPLIRVSRLMDAMQKKHRSTTLGQYKAPRMQAYTAGSTADTERSTLYSIKTADSGGRGATALTAAGMHSSEGILISTPGALEVVAERGASSVELKSGGKADAPRERDEEDVIAVTNRIKTVAVKHALLTIWITLVSVMSTTLVFLTYTIELIRISMIIVSFGLVLMYKEYDDVYHILCGFCHRKLSAVQC